jgi:DnaJ-class molecular chaperone
MVSKGKPEKIFKQCPICKGKKVLPWELAKLLPKPSKNIKCARCNGKGYEIGKPKN